MNRKIQKNKKKKNKKNQNTNVMPEDAKLGIMGLLSIIIPIIIALLVLHAIKII